MCANVVDDEKVWSPQHTPPVRNAEVDPINCETRWNNFDDNVAPELSIARALNFIPPSPSFVDLPISPGAVLRTDFIAW